MSAENHAGWKQMSIWFPVELKNALDEYARSNSTSVSKFVRETMQEKLDAQVIKCPHCRVDPDVEPHLAICPFAKYASAKTPDQPAE